jgi:hypothetical protein
MFREDGGVGTIGSSRRPALRAGVRGARAALRLACGRATFDAGLCPAAVDPAPVLFRAGDFARAAGRFVVLVFFAALFAPRFPVPADVGLRTGLDIFRETAGFLVPPALRLAMVVSFRNLDSLAISVVPSNAYRKSAARRRASADRNCGPPAPVITVPARARSSPGLVRVDRVTNEECARHGKC